MKPAEYLRGGPQEFIGADAVEEALAEAIRRATAAAQWEIVGQLARELEARRLARQAPEVVDLGARRRKGQP